VDLGVFHAWMPARSRWVDIPKLFHKCPFFATSTRGHLQIPRVDIALQQSERSMPDSISFVTSFQLL
jgi:hypothetical protein